MPRYRQQRQNRQHRKKRLPVQMKQQQSSPSPLSGQPKVIMTTREEFETIMRQLMKDNPDLGKTLQSVSESSQSANAHAPKRHLHGFLRGLSIAADVLTILGFVLNSVSGYQLPQAKNDSSEKMIVLLTNEESQQQWRLMKEWIKKPTQNEKELTFEISGNQLIVSNAQLSKDQSVETSPLLTFSGEQLSIKIDEIKPAYNRSSVSEKDVFQITTNPDTQQPGYFTAMFNIHQIPYELSIDTIFSDSSLQDIQQFTTNT